MAGDLGGSLLMRRRRFVDRIAVTLATGWIFAVLAFAVTAQVPSVTFLGGPGWHMTPAGFDPWTGEPYGPVVSGAGGPAISEPVPAELAGRRAVPMPLGFLIGSALGLIAALAWERRP